MSTYAPSITSRSRRPLVLVGLLIVLMSLWPLYGKVVQLVTDDHADNRHGGERYPPSAIRACLAKLVVDGVSPYQYESAVQDKVAVVCRLDYNRFGIQINRVITTADGRTFYREVTTFYSTLARMKSILLRDGYAPVVALPDSP